MILDDGGDLTLLMHDKYPDMLTDVRGISRGDHHRRAPAAGHGAGRHAADARDQRQRQRHQVEVRQPLRLPRILVDGIRRGTDVMMAGKVAVVNGFGDVGKGSAASPAQRRLPGDGDRGRSDLRLAGGDGGLPGHHHGRRRAASATSSSPPPATSTSSRIDHMRAMKHRAIVCNIGHFDAEIQIAALRNYQLGKRQAAGGRGGVPRRQAADRAVRGAAGEPGQRHRPSELRHERQLHQPGAGADRAVQRAAGTVPAAGLHAAEARSTRRWRRCIWPRSAPS